MSLYDEFDLHFLAIFQILMNVCKTLIPVTQRQTVKTHSVDMIASVRRAIIRQLKAHVQVIKITCWTHIKAKNALDRDVKGTKS